MCWVVPPFPLLARAAKKVQKERCQAIVIVPLWPKQPWFNPLVSLASEAKILEPLLHCHPDSNGKIPQLRIRPSD